MQRVAVAWHIWQLTKDEFALGLIGLANILPIFVLAIWGGVLADRVDRKKMILLTQIGMMIGSAVLAYTTYHGSVSPTLIYFLTAMNAVGVSFESPARTALLPRLVPEKHLQNALSLNIIMFH